MLEPSTNDEWPSGFDGHERAQRRRMAQWPLELKVAWLEEMQEMLEQSRATGHAASHHDQHNASDFNNASPERPNSASSRGGQAQS